MIERKKIYITFPSEETPDEWINDFLEHFKVGVFQVLNEQLDMLVKGRDFTAENYSSALSTADLYVLFIGAGNDEAYESEINEIYSLNASEETEKDPFSKVFKVQLSNLNTGADEPQLLKSKSYLFFKETKRRLTKPSPYSFQTEPTVIWEKLLDLIYDIRETFESFQSESSVHESKFVYLGNCSRDQEGSRDDLRRELQNLGYRVRPESSLLVGDELIKQQVTRDLRSCQLVIQLVGANYGNISSGEKISAYEIENDTIRDYLINHAEIKRLIWIPTEIRRIEQKQQLYINRIKQKDSDGQTEIMELDLEDFKNILSNLLANKQIDNEVAFKPHSVYYLSTTEEGGASLEEIAKESGVEFYSYRETGKTVAYTYHLEALKKIDCLLIDYTKTDFNWLSSKLKDIIKAQGLGREMPYLAIGIISQEMPDIDHLGAWLPTLIQIQPGDVKGVSDFFNIAKA